MGKSMEARRAGLLGFIVLLAAVGCSTAPVQEGPVVEPIFPASKVLDPRTHYASEVYDPWVRASGAKSAHACSASSGDEGLGESPFYFNEEK